MPTLTETDIALLARDVLDVLPDTGTILRLSASSDGTGGRSVSWTTLMTTPCRVMEAGAPAMDEQRIADHLRDKQLYIVAFPAGTDVRITDRIQTNGLILSIEGVKVPQSIEVERVVLATRAAA